MAIVTMKRFTLLTFQRDKAALLKELQRFGDVHLRKLKQDERDEYVSLYGDFTPEQASEYEAELENVKFAAAKIAPFVEKPKGLKAMTVKPPDLSFDELDMYAEGYDYRNIVIKVKELDDKISAIKADISKLNSENESLKAWLRLDVSPEALRSLESADAVLGTVNKAAAEAFGETVKRDFPNVYMESLGVTKDDAAVLVILPKSGFDDEFYKLKELGFSKSGFSFAGVPAETIAKNKEKIERLLQDQQKCFDSLAALTVEHEKLMIVADFYSTRLERVRACENLLRTDSAVMMEGWVPADDEARMCGFIQKACGDDFYIESAEAERDDTEVPVKLKNGRFATAFEDVTAMFATPKYNEIDPTPLLAPFYFLFFGFMVGDVGFGLVLMLGTFLGLKFCNFKEGMRRFLQFFFYCSFAVVLAGFVYGSFFGYPFFTPVPVYDAAGALTGHKVILDTQDDIPLMLILAIALGVVQVIFGLCVKGYMSIRDGHVLDAVFDSLFWIITLLGGICWLVGATGFIPADLATVGKWCFLGGIVGLLLTQGRSGETVAGKIAGSIWNVYGISGYVGDLVSYTRIVALGLSGAFIAFSFIKMAEIVPPGPIGAIFGFIIIFLGETLDFGLGLLGAYVHTCRLQYVEFFGKFYEGGGVPFKPLQTKQNYVQINKS